ncbi:MAG: hypothetical protein AAFV43_08545 [Planctomycetota bacterium]
MKLLPRFSLRAGLVSLTVVALLAVSLRAAVLGEPWAIGAGVGLLSIPALLLVHASFYSAARLLSRGSVPATDAAVPDNGRGQA